MTTARATVLPPVDRQAGAPPLLRVEPHGDAARWAAAHRDALRAGVAEHGALLVRGLGLRDAAAAGEVFRALGDLCTEREAFAPRTRHAPGVYSATRWPPAQPMCLHHELSYALEPPGLLQFACLVAPTRGGATPVADASAVLDALPPDLVERFAQVGWRLIRNYTDDVGASAADAFGTDDRAAIERYCRAQAIECQWLGAGALRTSQRRPAIVRHPRTGRRCWFNQVAFLSEWTLDPEVREYLVDVSGADGLPFTTRFGDGAPIGAEIVAAIHAAYARHTVREAWQAGDLLLVDNVRTAHGREPFEGPREVVVALADAARVGACR